MAWRVAGSLGVLLNEINLRSPARSKKSDGAIGDAAHASRDSDHNPWVKDGSTGVVTARDFTNDPAHGFDSSEFADWLRKRCKAGTEKRVKYIISDRRISSDIDDWAWRRYTGTNPHEHHVHVSVLPAKSLYDGKGSWGWLAAGQPAKPTPPTAATPPKEIPVTVFDLDDSKQIAPHRYTAADREAYGGTLTADTAGWSSILRFPPAVARLRRELAEAVRAIRGDITAARSDVTEVRTALAEVTRHVTELAAAVDRLAAAPAEPSSKPEA